MCSTIIFTHSGQTCFAENYDFSHDDGLIATNLRGTRKTNGADSCDKTISWTVKYGSVTFNQLSLELPVSGMNEAGLVIALMWHDEGDFGDSESFKRLHGLQWIQYQLDNFKTIAEVEQGLQTIRPERGPVSLHFTVLDAQGDSALIEFFGDEISVYRNVEFPILTNNSYASYANRLEIQSVGFCNSMRFFRVIRKRMTALRMAFCIWILSSNQRRMTSVFRGLVLTTKP